jgi:hypothetical protein
VLHPHPSCSTDPLQRVPRLSYSSAFSSSFLRVVYLQSISEELVHLGDLGGDGEIDGALANLNDEATEDIGVDLVGDLELLALANVLGLGDGGLEAVEGLVIKWLEVASVDDQCVRHHSQCMS